MTATTEPKKKGAAALSAASPAIPGERFAYRSRGGLAKLTEGYFRYKKGRVARLNRFLLFTAPALGLLLPPPGAAGQLVFDWPLRSATQPEAVITGAGSLFWNPGSLVSEVGTDREVWIIHVDGPDATGIGGVGFSGVTDIPQGFRVGAGYWHLGVDGIPRTTTSPEQEIGEIHVSEDVAVVAVAQSMGSMTGLGGGLRFQHGSAGKESLTRVEGELGIHHRATYLPFSPRFGLAIRGLGAELGTLAGAELTFPALASSRIPVRVGYGIQTDSRLRARDHRLSLRAAWMDQVHLGMGFSYLGRENGWTPLWMVGADIGRYSLSVLRESLANGFGATHYFQASLRFP